MHRFTQAILVVSGLACVSPPSQAQTFLSGADFRFMSLSTNGCQTLGTDKWYRTVRWKLAQSRTNPEAILTSAYRPGVCSFGNAPSNALRWGRPLTTQSCASPAPIPDYANWRAGGPIPVIDFFTPSGPWLLCDFRGDCNAPGFPSGTRPTRVSTGWDMQQFDPATGLIAQKFSQRIEEHITLEHATFVLLVTGLLGVGAIARRVRHRSTAA